MTKKNYNSVLTSLILVFTILYSCKDKYNSFIPGEIWLDNNDIHINAHGGGILVVENKYYWFGEHKTEGRGGNKANVGVHCYSSKDLYNWKDEGIALQVSTDSNSLLIKGCVIERPKVIYNEKNNQFIMWFHHELKGKGYDAALTGLAIASNVTGPYKYIDSYRTNKQQWPIEYTEELQGKIYDESLEAWTDEWKKAVKEGLFLKRDFETGQMARDMTLYVDKDGKAYHIHASEENLTLHISELSDDYKKFTGKYNRVTPGGHNEAPSIFNYNNKYYMITSGCTGWKPNAARLLVADSIMGKWEYIKNPCIGENMDITFKSQSTYILPVIGYDNAFIFMADRWKPRNAIDGRYVWLPILFDEQNIPYLKWLDEWDLSIFDK